MLELTLVRVVDLTSTLLYLYIFYLIVRLIDKKLNKGVYVMDNLTQPYFKKINQICFYVCLACLVAGLLLTLAMIWEIFPNQDVMMKAWISLATFFITALLISFVGSIFFAQPKEKK